MMDACFLIRVWRARGVGIGFEGKARGGCEFHSEVGWAFWQDIISQQRGQSLADAVDAGMRVSSNISFSVFVGACGTHILVCRCVASKVLGGMLLYIA